MERGSVMAVSIDNQKVQVFLQKDKIRRRGRKGEGESGGEHDCTT